MRAAGVGLCALALVTLGPASVSAQLRRPGEYELKAIFLYNFAKYVDWPEADFSEEGIRICVFGRDPFGPLLDRVVENERAHDRPLVILRLSRLEDGRRCQILFVDRSEEHRLEELLEAIAGHGVLTVGESDGFAERGGMIRLREEGSRIRIEINVGTARKAGLKLSSQLLKLARIVGDEGDR